MADDKKLWKVFSEFIRLRDSDKDGYGKCFTCPRVNHYTKMDCGHGIGRQHKATKYNEKNNHLQCKPCNGFDGGKREAYKAEMNRRYGPQTWDLMEVMAKQPTKWGKFEVEVMTKHYTALVKELKAKKAA